jgi:ABC-type oligopeptide transport system substrate-binding subunit
MKFARSSLLVLFALLLSGAGLPARAQPVRPEGEMRWALYITLSPNWFDPAEAVGQLTPFWVLYALHDALIKPLPGNLLAPNLAESWTASADGKSYEFKLREGLKFHNGDPFTAEDREVQLPSRPRQGHPGAGPRRRGGGPLSRTVRVTRALAGLSHLLWKPRVRRGVGGA